MLHPIPHCFVTQPSIWSPSLCIATERCLIAMNNAQIATYNCRSSHAVTADIGTFGGHNSLVFQSNWRVQTTSFSHTCIKER